MTIRRLRLLAFLGFLLLVAASVAVTFAALQTQREDALVINLAGRQRMLTQKMTLEVLGVQAGVDPGFREQLRTTEAVYFEQTLAALIAGGEAPYDDGATVTLPPTRDPAILAQLETIRAAWNEMDAAVHVVIGAELGSAALDEAAATVVRLAPEILSQMDRAVRLYEAEAVRKVARTQTIQIGFLAAAVMLLVGVLVGTDRLVLNPIARLTAAARRIGEGDLATSVSVAGPGEIDALARSFDDMRQSLAASRAELERWAVDLDARVAARTREIVHLSRVAQAANRRIEVGPLLDSVLPLVAEIAGASAAWVTLLDERGDFYLAGAHNLPPALESDDRAQMRWSGCLCQRKLLAGELTAAANILECERLERARGLAYHISAPIHVRGRALGVLNLTTAGDRVFDEDELRLLTAVGDQLSVVLERARLHEQLQARYVGEQAALLKLSQALLAESEPQAMMDLTVRAAAEALNVEFAAIALIDESNQSVSVHAGSIGWTPDIIRQAQRIPLEVTTGLAAAIRTRAPLVIPDETRETGLPLPPWARQMGIAASLIAPMLTAGKAIGGLVVNSRAPRDWSDDEVRLLALIANDTAQALERAWQHAHAQERLERISALHDIDVAITAPLTLQATLDVLLEKVAERLHVDAAAVALVQPETNELVYAAKRGLDGEFFMDARLKVKEGIVGGAAHSGKVAAIPDVRAEPRFVRASIAERLGLVSYLAVPLQARGEILGVLELAARQRHDFSPEEVDFFVTLAGQAAIVIDNTRMYEQAIRRAMQQRALAESAGGILATLDAEALWPGVTDAARQILAADRAAIYLYHADTDRVTCPYASDLSAEYVAEINRRFREVPGSRILSDPRPVVIADAQSDPAAGPVYDLAAREGFHSYAVFPLTAPAGPLGAFVVYRDRVAPFSTDDVSAGQTLAHVVAVALQNTRLFEAERAAREQAERLQAATQALSTTLDLQEIFDLILSELRRVVPYDSASVQQLKGERLEVIGGHGFPNLPELMGVSFDMTASDNPNCEVIRMRAPLILEDAPAVYAEFRREPHAAAGIRAWLGVPLLFGDRLIGMIAIDKREPGFYTEAHARLALAFAAQAAVAIENARLFEATRRQLEELTVLHAVAVAAAEADNEDALIERATRIIGETLYPDNFGVLLLDEAAGALRVHPSYRIRGGAQDISPIPLRHGITGQVAASGRSRRVPDVSREPAYLEIRGGMCSELCVPLKSGERVIGVINAESARPDAFSEADERLLTTLAGQLADGIERTRLFDETRQRAEELEAVALVAVALRQARTRAEMLPLLIEAAMQTMRADAGALMLLDEEGLLVAAARGPGEALLGQRYPPGDDSLWQVIRVGRPAFIADVSEHGEFARGEAGRALMAGMTACGCIPLQTAESTVGLLHVACRSRREPTEREKRLLTAIADMAGNAIHRATLHDETEHRLRLVEALRNIDMAITASLDVRLTLNVFLDQAMAQLRVDAAAVLLLNRHTQFLEYAAGRGFHSRAIEHSRLRLGEGYAGRAALEQQALHLPDLSQAEDYLRASLIRSEGFVGYYVTPLIVKGHVMGVFELFHRGPLHLSPVWLSFLEALAAQASIAIDNAGLYDDLQRSNAELVLTYDTTLEGWAKALELRDRETEGHTRRVTGMAERLAAAMGVGGESLAHLRRGALLHDIGKMGVPDSILLKPGPLTEDEWAIMRQHPLYAHNLLSPISFLRPALDIPYCHHEKWGGTGYPRGLKGEEIPLAARVFAVVDVWDALISDRPYRKAWSKEEALEYIRQQAGKHFDPKVVEVFLAAVV